MSLLRPTDALADAVDLSTRMLSADADDDVTVETGGYVLELDVPDAERADVTVDWSRGELTVRATVDGEVVHAETRRFPTVVDGDRITAATRADTLTVRLPVPRGAAAGAAGDGASAD